MNQLDTARRLAQQIAGAHLTRLKTLLLDASKGRCGRDVAVSIRVIETSIQHIVDELHSPITTIPGIGTRMGAMILAEIEISPGLILHTKCWPMPAFRPLPANLGS